MKGQVVHAEVIIYSNKTGVNNIHYLLQKKSPNNMRLAQSYNPNMVHDSSFIQDDAELIELGLHELSVVTDLRLRSLFPNLSLHIARSPMMEDESRQTMFVNTLKPVIENNSFYSIGFHLCGPRDFGIGRLGFTPHFEFQQSAREKIPLFIDKLRQLYSGEIWFENANFYSAQRSFAQETYRFLTQIATRHQVGIILDLTHILIEAQNLKVSSFSLLNEIDFSAVREIHLSGMICDSQGIVHDGHSKPIAEDVWWLLECIFPELPKTCFITIEHSDPIFKDQRDLFDADFNRLRTWLQKKEREKKTVLTPNFYAKKYLAKILLKHIKNLDSFLQNNQLSILDELDQFLAEQDNHPFCFVIDPHEVNYFPLGDAKHLASEFLRYLKNRVHQ